MAWKDQSAELAAQSGLNARDWASQNACLIDVGYFIHDRLRPHRQVPADLGVKESGLWPPMFAAKLLPRMIRSLSP